MKTPAPIRTAALIAALTLALAVVAQGATVPYIENFDTYTPPGPPANFVTAASSPVYTASSTWTVIAANGADQLSTSQQYRNVMTVSGSGTSSFFEAESNLSIPTLPGKNFTISYDFEIEDRVGTNAKRIGFEVLASDALVGVTGYFVQWNLDTGTNNGNLEISGFSTSALTLFYAIDTPYTLTITGTYATPGNPNSALTLNAALTNGTSSITTGTVAATPLTGEYFGFRNRLFGPSNSPSLTMDYDNLSITAEALVVVPGPAALPAGLCLLAVASLRRRR